MNNSNTKAMQSLEKDFEAQIKLNSIIRHLNKPILDTLQKNWDVERVLYFSFSGTTLSDMRANKTIISNLTPDLLIRFMTSMSISTTITRKRNSELVIDPELTQDNNDAFRRNNDGGSITQRPRENTGVTPGSIRTGVGISEYENQDKAILNLVQK